MNPATQVPPFSPPLNQTQAFFFPFAPPYLVKDSSDLGVTSAEKEVFL